MLLGVPPRALHGGWISGFGLVESLPGAECSAHWRANEEVRTISTDHLQGFVSFVLPGKVPRATVVLVDDGEVESKPWK